MGHMFTPLNKDCAIVARQASICILIIIISLMFSCAENKKENALKYINSARQFIARQKPETALIEYRNALELDPDNDTALFELAETYILMNKVDSAIRYYTLAALTNPNRIEPHLRLAHIYTRTDRLLAARAQITKALDVDSTSVKARHLLSGIQIMERDFDAAIATLKQAESLEPANIKTRLALAQLYVKTDKLSAAEDNYLTAMSLDPSSRDAYMGLVRLYYVRKQWQKIEHLLITVVDTPGIPAVKLNDLARFYENLGEKQKAESYFKKAMEAAPKKIFPVMALARFYTTTEQKDLALATLNTGLDTYRDNPKSTGMLLVGLSRIYLHYNEVEKAAASVDKALVIQKKNSDALFQKGRVLMAKKDFKQALDTFDQVLGLNRFHARAFYYRAICIQERGASDRPEQKIFRAAAGMLDNPEEFEKKQIRENLMAALAIDPTLVEARRTLATQYLLENRAGKAQEQVDEILKLRPPDHLTMNIVAGINYLTGNEEKAEEILNTIVKENPDYVPAYIRLAFFYKKKNEIQKAVFFFTKAYEKEPTALGLADEIIGIYAGEKNFAKALKMIDQYAAGAGQAAGPFFSNLRGEVLLSAGKEKKAVTAFEHAAAQAPGFIRPQMRLARYWVGNGKPAKALEHYLAVEKIDPNYLPALTGIAMIKDAVRDLDQAEAYYRRILILDARNAPVANNLAFLLSEKKGGLEEAFRLAQTARTLSSDNPDVLDTLGWIYYLKGSYFNAISEFEEGLKLAPDSAIIQYHYGMALYMTKSYEKARVHLKKALALDSNFRGADEARRILN